MKNQKKQTLQSEIQDLFVDSNTLVYSDLQNMTIYNKNFDRIKVEEKKRIKSLKKVLNEKSVRKQFTKSKTKR